MEIAAAGGGGCGGGGDSWLLGSGFMGTENPWRDNPSAKDYAKIYKYTEPGSIEATPPKSGWFGVAARAGSVHCIYSELSPQKVDENTAASMARRFQTELDEFYVINPELKKNWKNMLPMTRYCVRGCELRSDHHTPGDR